jgi:hypothetical protein
MPCQRSLYFDAQGTVRPDADKRPFGVFNILKDAAAAATVGVAVRDRRTLRVVRCNKDTPSRVSMSLITFVAVERGMSISFAACVKLRRSTMRMNKRIASNESIFALFVCPDETLHPD